jgi:hypothetical protein
VQSLADEWGVAQAGHGAGKSVWFALATRVTAR